MFAGQSESTDTNCHFESRGMAKAQTMGCKYKLRRISKDLHVTGMDRSRHEKCK